MNSFNNGMDFSRELERYAGLLMADQEPGRTIKFIGYVDSHHGFSLEVYECGFCGFHIGIDSTYLEQNGGLMFLCPSCKLSHYVKGFENGNTITNPTTD